MNQDSLHALHADTLRLLEWRLTRLEFVLSGNLDTPGSDEQGSVQERSVQSRIERLEQALYQLTLKSEVARELVKLQAKLPDLFQPEEAQDEHPEPDASQKLSMVLAEAPAYSEVASQLRHLQDLALPSSEAFSKLVTEQPRIAQLQQQQYAQAMEISELRKRGGALILQWHELFILGQGRCWAEWDTRLRNSERVVRREEVRRSRDG